MPMVGIAITKRVIAGRYNGTMIKATHLLLDKTKLLQKGYGKEI